MTEADEWQPDETELLNPPPLLLGFMLSAGASIAIWIAIAIGAWAIVTLV